MPPADDILGHNDHFLTDFYDFFHCWPNGNPVSPPYLSYLGEPWMTSPASVATDTDDDSSLASSISSLSPDQYTSLGDIPDEEDQDDENFYSTSPSIYHLEQYPLRTSPYPGHEDVDHLDDDDDDLLPLAFSPPALDSLNLLSLSESEHQPTSALNITKPSTNNPPPPPLYDDSFFDYDPSSPVPSSPSLRRLSILPELEPTTFDDDPFGLHRSFPTEQPTSPPPPTVHNVDTNMPDFRWRSLPGWETDDDLIPAELASKNYIPDPSAIVPTTSTGIRSLLLWDHNNNPDRSDIPTPRSPSPENFHLDPSVLAECDDEELQKVYELRQRTAKNEKWERERCRELSALLRLKLDERGAHSGGGNECSSGSPSSSSNPSGDSITVYQPQPKTPSSFSSPSLYSSTQNSPISSSSPSSTLRKPQSEVSKHKIRSMAQLVASMLFHRQQDALSRHLTRKSRFAPIQSSTNLSSTTGLKLLPTPRSRLSEVILPEELEEEEMGQEVESSEELGVDGRPSSHRCDLDARCGNSNSHAVTVAAPSSMQ